MCAPSQGAMLPYGLKVPSPYFPFAPSGSLTQAHLSALDFQRSQLNDYNARMQFGLRNYPNSIGLSPFHAYISDPYTQAYFYKNDQRARFVQEEPKPSHSYIGLIGMAILNSKDKKLVLSDIYQWILDNYPYFRSRGPGWRNSIRHNLSLNDCFIKAGRSANGKGYYWAVHPANVEDFERGDFRRRRAQRKVRRHMGLSVPDDDDSPTPSPTQTWSHHDMVQESERNHLDSLTSADEAELRSNFPRSDSEHIVFCHPTPIYGHVLVQPKKPSRKRLFDMASLLAPDDDRDDIKNDEVQIKNERMDGDKTHSFNINTDSQGIQSQEKVEDFTNRSVQSNESYSYEDVNVDINSPTSGSGRDMRDNSEDDGENDEIQVTSGEDSPHHNQGVHFDGGEGQSSNDIFQNSSKKKPGMKTKNASENDERTQSKCSSSPYKTESKTENALDLSSSNHPEDDKKDGGSNANGPYQKLFSVHSSVKDCDFRQQHLVGKSGLGDNKVETELENSNGYTNFNQMSNSCVASLYNMTRKGSDLDKSNETDDNVIKLFHNDRCRNIESMSLEKSPGIEYHQQTANKFYNYRLECQESHQQLSQEQRDSNIGVLSDRLNESDQFIPSDKLGYTSEAPTAESIKISNDYVGWVEMSKSGLLKDRLSAFSALGIRNHCIYSPLQLINVPLSSHRLLPKSTISMKAGGPSPLMPVDSSPTPLTSLPVELDTTFNKCNYKILNSVCSSAQVEGANK